MNGLGIALWHYRNVVGVGVAPDAPWAGDQRDLGVWTYPHQHASGGDATRYELGVGERREL